MACEDTYESERTAALMLIESAQAKQVWIGDRHFCTQAILEGLAERGAGFIVREHALHPRLQPSGKWSAKTDTETGRVREQAIELAQPNEGAMQPWRRIEIALDTPTTDGERSIVLWSNLPSPRADNDPESLAQRLLLLAAKMRPKQLATSKRQPKTAKSKAYVDTRTASSHFSTARVLKNSWKRP